MKYNKLYLIIIVIMIIIFGSCYYTVNQRFVAFEKSLGKVKLVNNKPIIIQPGLHFKMPLVTEVIYFDTRLQTLGSKPERIPTKEQKFVYVDYFVKWRVKDYYKFYLSTRGDYSVLNELLKPQVSDALKAEFGKKIIEEVVSEDRTNVMTTVRDAVRVKSERQLGVDIVDLRIKKIDLPEEVRDSVYNRMRTKRQQVANAHRYNGQKKSEEIKAQADFDSKKIVAEAQKQGEVTRGEADGKAAKVYSDSFNQDPEFYDFYRSLAAYDSVFKNGENVLVLSPDSEFFKYFSHQKSKS